MRQSGILMHITSLPGAYGVGTMGKSAYDFVDFLEKAGQRIWQLLPLNPTGYGDSPYQSCSTYAGNHYLIDLDLLIREGLLTEADLAGISWGDREDRVDFGLQYENRLPVLRKAFARFQNTAALEEFARENSSWLPDFALYMALKDRFGGKPWHEWEDKLKHRNADALWQARQELSDEIAFYTFVQYLFDCQWKALRAYAHEHGVRLIGDVPIYVPLDSVEVWCAPELFALDSALQPTAVAGCPPDSFSEDGQLWGNPLYRWEEMAKDGYHWWIRRLAAAGERFDVVRVDHFRGLESYWSVPYGDTTARNGRWILGPGMDFIRAIHSQLPNLEIIAEDLGFLTPEVLALRDNSGFPGMKVLEFAFDSLEPSECLPHNYIQNTVCYTGTHDNMTVRQWLETALEETVAYARDYMRLTQEEGYVTGTIRTAMSSISDLCVIPLQDWLCLGAEARMNTPGTTGGNWVWRTAPGSYSDTLAAKIYHMTGLYGRFGK